MRESPPIEDVVSPPAPSISFVELWARISRSACAALASSLPHQTEAAVLSDLRENLTLRLSQVGEGAVWEHFNTQRTLKDLIKAHLDVDQGSCRRTLYCRVIEALRADGLQELSTEYPVLRRHLSATVASWLASSRELLLRVHRDHEMLTEKFDLPLGARLIGVKTGISDPHRGGRSVAILTFGTDSANQVSIVYKPRDLRIDAAYHGLISEVSATTSDAPPLHSLTVLPLDGYGYVEYIAHEICSSDEELADFYHNAGRLTAILYVLGCNDCHNENVIAHRNQLILVDAETLLQGVRHHAIPHAGSPTARDILEGRVGNSVVRIGLLPHWFFIAGERIPRDVSALGIEPTAAEHEACTGWSALNTDGMVTGPAMRRARLPMSLPVGIGSPNRLNDFTTDYCAGFRCQLEVIAADRGSWLGDDGHLERFRDLRTRFIRRPTWIYLWMRGKLLESAALRDEAAQREALTRLGKPRRADIDIHDDAILAAERAQLSQLDVPFFEHAIAGRDLVLDNSDVALDFFAHSGLEAARRRIESLGADDIQLQLALIEDLLAAKVRRAHQQKRDPSLSHFAVDAPSAQVRLDAATAVGNLLVNTSLTDERGNVEWVGINSATDLERSCYGTLGPTLYGGRMGIAIFLATLAGAGSDQRGNIYRGLATFACADLIRLLEFERLRKTDVVA